MRNKVVLKRIFGICYAKMHDFRGNPLYNSQKGGMLTKSIVSRVLLILEHSTWYQVEA